MLCCLKQVSKVPDTWHATTDLKNVIIFFFCILVWKGLLEVIFPLFIKNNNIHVVFSMTMQIPPVSLTVQSKKIWTILTVSEYLMDSFYQLCWIRMRWLLVQRTWWHTCILRIRNKVRFSLDSGTCHIHGNLRVVILRVPRHPLQSKR